MANSQFTTSFIPKKPLKDTGRSRIVPGVGVFTGLALIIALLMFAAGVGVFIYGEFLKRSIDQQNATLERARSAFAPELIRELQRTDERIKAAESVLDEHFSTVAFFAELGDITLQDVRFTEFSFQSMNGSAATLDMSGEATSFNAVALQARSFGESPILISPIFSGLSVTSENEIEFSVTAEIDLDKIRYADHLGLYTNARLPVGTSTPSQ